jgi:hypothetical protein
VVPAEWRNLLPGIPWRGLETLQEGYLGERTNKFTLLAGPAERCRGEPPGGWVGKAGRTQRLVGVRDPGGERLAEAVAKQVTIVVKRKQFVKKFVSEQWILSCKSLGRPLVYHL